MPKKMTKMEILTEQQVVLSKERTILSFMQTGLAFIGVGLVVVNVFRNTFSELIGYLLMIVGFVEALESIRRLRSKQKEMDELKRSLSKA